MKAPRFAICACAVAVMLGCGGTTGPNPFGQFGYGLRFVNSNPNAVLSGTRVDLLVRVSPIDSSEEGQSYQATATVDGGASVDNPAWSGTIGSSTSAGFHMVTVDIPDNTPEGTHFHVHVSRSTSLPLTAGSQTSDTLDVTVGSRVVVGAFTGQGDTVTGIPGATVTSTLTLTGIGAASGLVTLRSQLPGVTVTPSSATMVANTPIQAEVTFAIPAGAQDGTTIDVPVFFSTLTGRGFVMLHVHVGQQQQGDFTFGVSRTQVFVSPGHDSDSVVTTVSPTNGFTGLVTVTITFSNNLYSVAPPQTNPFTINVVSASPGTASFQVRQAGQNVASRGTPTATVTATGGGHTHTATIEIRPLS